MTGHRDYGSVSLAPSHRSGWKTAVGKLDSRDVFRRRPVFAAVLATLASAAMLFGCGGDDDSGTSPNTANGGEAIVTGSAKCDQASIEVAVKSWSRANGGDKVSLPDAPGAFRCADGWAVAFPNVGSGEAEVTVTAVFEAEGQFWIPKDRAKVCGKSAADSEVPSSLYKAACQTN